MALRLVDGGIPSFEWKMKRFEIPFSENELIELKKKVEVGELDEKKAFKKRYEMKDSPEANLELYRKILKKLPTMPGNLVVAKCSDGKLEIIEIFKSEFDLREDFKNSTKTIKENSTDRFNWLKNLTKENKACSIQFFIGRAA